MDFDEANRNGLKQEAWLPPPPPVLPSNIVPELELVKKTTLLPMARRGTGTKGQKIQLRTNHFKVNFTKPDGYFYHYSVAITYEDGRPVEAKGIGRKILDKVQETYKSDLGSKYFAYDGEKTLFTVGALPSNKLDFSVVLEEMTSSRNNNGKDSPNETNDGDRKRSRRPYQSKKFMVEISYAAKIPMQAIASALQGKETDSHQDAIRVLDVILRQSAARQGCLLVRQSFFHNDPKNFVPIGGGVIGCRGFHSSFRTTQGGLSLNIDVSTTMIVQPGAVADFLCGNQNVKDPFSVNWEKAKRTLKNLRVKVFPTNREYKITGLSEKTCRDQLFTLRKPNVNGEIQEVEITVSEYFNSRNIPLKYSDDLPCINVGKPKRPTYFPIEQWYHLEPFHSTFEVHNILHRSIDTEQALAAMKICRSRRKGTMVKKRSTRPFLLIVLILLSICFGVAAEPYTIFRVDSDGNCFTEHPWKLFHIACLKAGKFLAVALVVGLIIGLIIIVFKWLNPTQAEEEKREDGISSEQKEREIFAESKEHEIEETEAKEASVNQLATNFGISEISSEQKERKILVEILVESKEHEIEETEAKEASVNQLATNFGISEINPCMEVGGFKVFKGTRDNRLVSAKQIPFSDTALKIAKNERKIHHACEENDSSNILQFHNFDVVDGFIYVCFRHWECTVGDLIRYCGGKDARYLYKKQHLFLEKLIREKEFSEVHLVRNLIAGVADLHSLGIVHRNINPDNFFIISKGEEIIAKLGGLSMGKLKEHSETLEEQTRFAPEQTQRNNKKEGLTNDIFFLGCVVGFVISGGQDIYENDFKGDVSVSDLIYNNEAIEILKKAPDANQLIKNLTRRPWNLRLTAERALAEPFFWPWPKKVHFYELASSRLVGIVDQKVLNTVIRSKGIVMGNDRTWDKRLDQAVKKVIANSYRTDHVTDLVRFVRNCLSHCDEYKDDKALTSIVGITQKSVLEYFTEKFPELLVQVHIIVGLHFQTEKNFEYFFTDKGTP